MPDTPAPSPAPTPAPRGVRRWVTLGATAAGLTALATAGLAGAAGTARADLDDHAVLLTDSHGTRTIVVDGPLRAYASATPTTDPGTEGAEAPAASEATKGQAPQMRLQMAYKRTGPDLSLTIKLTGFAYAPLDAANKPLALSDPATAAIGLGQELVWGDGTGSTSGPGDKHCGKPAVLHKVEDAYTLTHTYKGPGTYNVVYTFFACGLTDGKITATLPITVAAPPPTTAPDAPEAPPAAPPA